MGRDDTRFMALVEFVRLLNPLESAAQSPETLEAPVFFIIIRGKIVLKRKHGINGVEVIGQRPKQGVDDDPLPGLIGHRFSVMPIHGVRMGKALVADFLDGRTARRPA